MKIDSRVPEDISVQFREVQLPKPFGVVATFCFFMKDKQIKSIGITSRSLKDNFIRKTGKINAFNRALKSYENKCNCDPVIKLPILKVISMKCKIEDITMCSLYFTDAKINDGKYIIYVVQNLAQILIYKITTYRGLFCPSSDTIKMLKKISCYK